MKLDVAAVAAVVAAVAAVAAAVNYKFLRRDSPLWTPKLLIMKDIRIDGGVVVVKVTFAIVVTSSKFVQIMHLVFFNNSFECTCQV